MIAEEMAELLRREFWCFDTYTETGNKEFTEQMALKNAIKHCGLIINSDPLREHMEYDYNQNKLGIDDDFWGDVLARLEKRLQEHKKLNP